MSVFYGSVVLTLSKVKNKIFGSVASNLTKIII